MNLDKLKNNKIQNKQNNNKSAFVKKKKKTNKIKQKNKLK